MCTSIWSFQFWTQLLLHFIPRVGVVGYKLRRGPWEEPFVENDVWRPYMQSSLFFMDSLMSQIVSLLSIFHLSEIKGFFGSVSETLSPVISLCEINFLEDALAYQLVELVASAFIFTVGFLWARCIGKYDTAWNFFDIGLFEFRLNVPVAIARVIFIQSSSNAAEYSIGERSYAFVFSWLLVALVFACIGRHRQLTAEFAYPLSHNTMLAWILPNGMWTMLFVVTFVVNISDNFTKVVLEWILPSVGFLSVMAIVVCSASERYNMFRAVTDEDVERDPNMTSYSASVTMAIIAGISGGLLFSVIALFLFFEFALLAIRLMKVGTYFATIRLMISLWRNPPVEEESAERGGRGGRGGRRGGRRGRGRGGRGGGGGGAVGGEEDDGNKREPVVGGWGGGVVLGVGRGLGEVGGAAVGGGQNGAVEEGAGGGMGERGARGGGDRGEREGGNGENGRGRRASSPAPSSALDPAPQQTHVASRISRPDSPTLQNSRRSSRRSLSPTRSRAAHPPLTMKLRSKGDA